MKIYLPITLSLMALGCSESNKTEKVDEASEGATQEDFDALAGTEWIVRDQGTGDEDSMHRLKIEKDGDQFYVLFSGARKDRVARGNWPRNWAADVGRYDCVFEAAGGEQRLGCTEMGRAWEWCMLAMTQGQDCTLEIIQAMDPSATEDDLKEGIQIAKIEIEAFQNRNRGSITDLNQQHIELWNRVYETDRSKLGISIMEEDVLKVMDTFKDLSLKDEDGKLVAEAEGGGVNERSGWEFVPNEDSDLLWDHCDLGRRYITMNDEGSYPENPFKKPLVGKDRATYTTGQEITFTHSQPSTDVLGTAQKPLDAGCSFSFDAYHRGVLVEAGMKGDVNTAMNPRTKKEEAYARVQWTHSFDEVSPDHEYYPDVVTLVIEKQCPGKESEKLVACQDLDIQ